MNIVIIIVVIIITSFVEICENDSEESDVGSFKGPVLVGLFRANCFVGVELNVWLCALCVFMWVKVLCMGFGVVRLVIACKKLFIMLHHNIKFKSHLATYQVIKE